MFCWRVLLTLLRGLFVNFPQQPATMIMALWVEECGRITTAVEPELNCLFYSAMNSRFSHLSGQQSC